MTSVAMYLLHFIKFFSSDKVGWWSGIVWSVGIGLYIWG